MSINNKIYIQVVTYNHGKYLGECLESLIQQSIQPYKIGIFDDCSDEDSVEIINRYKHTYPDLFELHLQTTNLGNDLHEKYITSYVNSLNDIDYITLIEGDDYWAPKKLEFEYRAIQKDPNSLFSYSNVEMVDQKGDHLCYFHSPDGPPLKKGNLFFSTATRTIFDSTANCFRNYLINFPIYKKLKYKRNDKIPSMGDYQMHLFLSFHGRVTASDTTEPLVYYRRHPCGISNNSEDVAISGMMIYENFDDYFRKLDPQSELLCRLKQELSISLSYPILPEDKKEVYHPDKIYSRLINRVKELPSNQAINFMQQATVLLRNLLYTGLAICINEKEYIRAITFRTIFHENDSTPLNTAFNTPPDIHQILHQEFKKHFP